MIFRRNIQPLVESWLFRKKVIIIYGARQVGKTTLAKDLLSTHKKPTAYFNCDWIYVQEAFSEPNPEKLKSSLQQAELVVLDEAQRIENIGLILKVLVDAYPEIQIIATGSSSFDLANKVGEPLTGRQVKFWLYPLSALELTQKYNPLQLNGLLESILLYGTYPDVVTSYDTPAEAKLKLAEITGSYLYKDILEMENLRKPELLVNLLKALALQLGSEFTYRELAKLLGTTPNTIQTYIDLLEKSFVIFRLHSFSRNLRKELGKRNKVYFYDLGVRNSLLNNFTPLNSRSDTGALWENFCLVERLKNHQRHSRQPNLYFWKTYQQKEIDLVEEADGQLKAFEFKWSAKAKVKKPQEFLETYPESTFEVIHTDNWWQFVGI